MALPENTSGAVHLTSLSLDISELQKQVDTIEKEMDELGKKATTAGQQVKKAFSGGLGGTGTRGGGKGGSGSSSGGGTSDGTRKEISATEQAIANLQKSYATLEKTIATSRLIPTDQLDFFARNIKSAQDALQGYRLEAQETGKITGDSAKDFEELKIKLTDLNRAYSELMTGVTNSQSGFKTGADAVKNLDSTLKSFSSSAIAAQKNLLAFNKENTVLDTNSVAFRKMKVEANALATEMSELNKRVQENGTVNKEDLVALESLNKRLSDSKLAMVETTNEALRTGQSLKQIREEAQKITTGQIEKLNLEYKNFLTTLSGSKLTDNQLKQIPKDAQDAASKMLELTNEVTKNGVVSKEQARLYEELSSTLKNLKGQYADTRTEANNQARQFKEMEKAISDTIPKLREFEKTATFKSARTEAAALRAEYKTLADNIKAGNLSVGDAQSQLDNLGQRFNDFANHVKTGNTALQNFVDKISESAKWQVANILINEVRQAFGQLSETITKTEDAVIELRRVLGSQAPANTAMSDELYDIAYEFGQTFDAVQQTAVRFAQTGRNWEETIAATRAAMLALNTAELDTTTATEGLIAVMAQFNIQADELEAVIDKINITADNFPVTSENIVAALQRAGGTASAFNMSLEETIATITALSAATGRAGANIGTALNSLISFSMKDSALDKFSEFLGKDVSDYGVLQLWTELSEAIHGSGEELATMMSQSEEFSDLMDETLATSIGLEEEYNNALAEQNQMLKDGKDIYSTVGTYRQNYFIALLRNIGTATEALENMDNAIGYSAEENLTAMEAFNKKWQQLVVSLQELAVQLGESGLLDFMKLLVETTTAVVRFTNSIGGLTTVMLGLSAVFFRVKEAAIEKHFENLALSAKGLVAIIKNVPKAFGTFSTALKSGAGATAALSESLSHIGIVSIPSVISGVLAATTIIYAFYSKWKDQQEKVRKEIIQTGQEAADSLSSMYEAEKKFNSSTGDDRVTAAKELLGTLGFTQDEIDDISGKLKEQAGNEQAINDIIAERLEMKFQEHKLAQEEAYKTQEQTARESFDVSGFNFGEYAEDRENVLKVTRELNISEDEFYNRLREFGNLSGDVNKKIEDSSTYLKAFNSALNDNEKENSYVYRRLRETNKALGDYVDQSQSGIDMTARQSDSWIEYSEKSKEAEEAANNFAEAISGTAKANEYLSLSAEDLQSRIDSLSQSYDNLTSKIDSFQSSYKTLDSIISEYNETGILTADMLQSILSLEPEYIELLQVSGGQISINEEKLKDLIATTDDRMEQLEIARISEAFYTQVQKLAAMETDNMTEAEIRAAIASETLSGEAGKVIQAFMTGRTTSAQFKTALGKIAEAAGVTGKAIGIVTDNIFGMANAVKGLNGLAIKTFSSNLIGGKTFNQINEEFNKGIITFKEYKDAYNKYIKGEFDAPIGSNLDFYVGGTSIKPSGGGGGSSSTKKTAADILNEKAQNAISSLKEMMEVYEHTIDLIGRNRGNAEKLKDVPFFSDFEKKGENYVESQVAIYREMQKKTHELANQFREMGYGEDSEYIRELQQLHWSYHDAIIDLYQDMYDQQINEHENMIDELSYQYDQLEKAQDFSGMTDNLSKQIAEQKAIQESALKEYTKLLEVGVDKNDDAVQSALKTIRDAANEIQAINGKIKENVLGAYDDFISAADKFDLWDNLDFTKVDYLQRKMQAINQLFRDGTITLQEYNNQLREMTEAMYDAQIEQFQKEQEETEKYYDDLIDKRKEDIETLKKQKDETKDYYDTIIDGYKEEIEQWEKRKSEITEYYDELIDALNEVQDDNDRINRQIDYYNSRQKIITNLEQAQARSGVEWREKEMEYQQQLIELDEEWNRTRQEWSIADQIEELNQIRDAALADIDASIEKINENIEVVEQQSTNAINNIESEIAGIEDVIDDLEKQSEAAIDRIEERIKDLSKQIAEAFSSASMNGMLNTTQAINSAFANAGSKLFGGGLTSVGTGIGNSLSGYGSGLTSSLVNSAQTASKKALETLKNNFVNPALPLFGTLGTALGTALSVGIKSANIGSGTKALMANKGLSSSIRNVMNSATAPAASNINSMIARNTNLANSATNSLKTGSGNATIYVTNNVNSVDSAADKTNNIIQNLGI